MLIFMRGNKGIRRIRIKRSCLAISVFESYN